MCYPVRYIGVNEEREFLKFWEMYLEIVPQISESGYNLLTIASFTELLDVQQEEFIKAATKLVWSTEYNEKPKYRLKGLIEILWIIIQTCVEKTEEGLFLTPKLNRVKEKIENNCELQLYGYTLSDGEVNRRFEKDKLRELQKSITYSKNDIIYPKAWVNIDLTNEILKRFIESNNFEEETIKYPSIDDDICENDTYQGIYNILKEEGLEITIEDILRIINILTFTPEQIYDYKFIEVYNNHQHLGDDEVGEILLDWIRNQQTREIYEEIEFESGDENFDEENVINTPPNP
ncbi:hypothetical protein RclHR1_10490009 [Rhizophagus clarus]|uniref:Uncharacterized protein n=1 Tax=Rhizophagus clarus TaxID=94130 RepID=A0A2Z6Q2V9_9GLOM|nr:hypothetical protein RclHR1_10490009 [Rhizophagus clarus]